MLGVLNLADVTMQKGLHMTNFATGCIFHYDDKFTIESGKVWKLLHTHTHIQTTTTTQRSPHLKHSYLLLLLAVVLKDPGYMVVELN